MEESNKAEAKAANVLLIGKKSLKNYLNYALRFQGEPIVIKARGSLISDGVTVAELLKRNLKYRVDGIELGIEELENKQEGRKRRVSTMVITLSREWE